jgi:formylglycine-generating enzyme required for sulfatase activity
MLYQKPIDLRHICLFYLGHIPTFLDIHLSNLLQEANTEPTEFKDIFERGIDPDVDDPTQCHSHSEVPENDDAWPSKTTILKFQSAVRSRLMKLYNNFDSGEISLTRNIARVLFMTLEHEAMHVETLLYMLIQRAGSGTLPPTCFTTPPWTSLAEVWNTSPTPQTKTVILGPAVVSLGHDDDEADDDDTRSLEGHEFGWDNEHPKRQVKIDRFNIEWRPVTNGEFYQFYIGIGRDKVSFPASWVNDGGITKVRTLYGPVPLEIAKNWPIVTSYDDLSIYAIVKGGRLPTEAELRHFYDNFDSGYVGGANVGFRNWHPVPATTGCEKYGGKGSNGGVWEWTSTLLDKVDGFVPSKLYPGYSMDFFDGKHHVVLGGSYATIPRISERRSFRNWYQCNYPYAWVGGRIVYDIPN